MNPKEQTLLFIPSNIDWNTLSKLWTFDPLRPLLFSSRDFLVLFVLFFGIYLLLKRLPDLRIFFATAFSLFFYYKCSGWFLILLVVSTIVDFILGHFIYRAPSRGLQKFALWLSILFNLGMLAYFKYTNFLIGTSNYLAGTDWAYQNILLPAGISFFAFQTMSYSIDVYRRQIVPLTEYVHDFPSFLRQLMDFGFFVTFFPQLVAGPIVRAADFLSQIRKPLQLNQTQMGRAFFLIMSGLIKKAIISDYISVNYVDRIFDNPSLYSGLENLLGAYGYAIQIYCDFSGYSDMAIGLALLLGFWLPDNFLTPYKSSSIQEFWRRWHISLSSWLRDYLYISLGGNQKGKFRTYLNLMITMLLGGLWHGANWVFIAWGGLHGLALSVDRLFSRGGKFISNPAWRAFMICFLVQLGLEGWWFNQYVKGYMSPDHFLQFSFVNLGIFNFLLLLCLLAVVVDFVSRRLILGPFVGAFVVFHFVTFCWILFRAGAVNADGVPLETAMNMLSQIALNFHPELWFQLWEGYKAVILLIILGFVLHFLPNRWYNFWEKVFARSPVPVQSLVLALVIWLVIQTASSELVPFIYFQF
jgi:D-alanyl-lipoteichoic acid acyltransferase DltB (MBOAT superfamily)